MPACAWSTRETEGHPRTRPGTPDTQGEARAGGHARGLSTGYGRAVRVTQVTGRPRDDHDVNTRGRRVRDWTGQGRDAGTADRVPGAGLGGECRADRRPFPAWHGQSGGLHPRSAETPRT